MNDPLTDQSIGSNTPQITLLLPEKNLLRRTRQTHAQPLDALAGLHRHPGSKMVIPPHQLLPHPKQKRSA